mmetsp:Transcript_61286/g.145928  ORF Transcript_61286/g.145928 Transcript_61286/m.145928 type:complete len:204 (+) Transcript_61286:509-1120(+)
MFWSPSTTVAFTVTSSIASSKGTGCTSSCSLRFTRAKLNVSSGWNAPKSGIVGGAMISPNTRLSGSGRASSLVNFSQSRCGTLNTRESALSGVRRLAAVVSFRYADSKGSFQRSAHRLAGGSGFFTTASCKYRKQPSSSASQQQCVASRAVTTLSAGQWTRTYADWHIHKAAPLADSTPRFGIADHPCSGPRCCQCFSDTSPR